MEKQSFKIPYETLKKTKLQFPYMPDDIRYTGCCAIKKNGDLYTPCCAKTKDSEYCQSCSVDKEGNAKELPYGSVEEREQNIADGKFKPVTYAGWLKKAKKTITEVYEALHENGISLVIPAAELEMRDVPKNRKGRPAKSDDSAGSKSKGSKKSEPDEEEGYSSATSSVSSKSSQGSKRSKAPEPEDEDEPEPVKKSKKPKAPEPEEEPVKVKKSKKPKAEPEDEDAEPVKPKKAKKEKADKAEKPKKEKKDKAEKPKKEKKDKAEKPKKEKKEVKEPEDDDTGVAVGELDPEEEEMETETRIINGKQYMRTGDSAVIYDGRGTVVGSVNEDGDWIDNAGHEMVNEEAEFSEDE
jgi:hypothetical protein